MSMFKLAQDILINVERDNRKDVMVLFWESGYLSTIEMAKLMWEHKVSSRYFKGFNLKAICARFDPENIENNLEVNFDVANMLAYAATRLYICEDDMIEIMHGMHQDVLKGELESHVLS